MRGLLIALLFIGSTISNAADLSTYRILEDGYASDPVSIEYGQHLYFKGVVLSYSLAAGQVITFESSEDSDDRVRLLLDRRGYDFNDDFKVGTEIEVVKLSGTGELIISSKWKTKLISGKE